MLGGISLLGFRVETSSFFIRDLLIYDGEGSLPAWGEMCSIREIYL